MHSTPAEVSDLNSYFCVNAVPNVSENHIAIVVIIFT